MQDKDVVISALINALLGCREYIKEANPLDSEIIEDIDAVLAAVQILKGSNIQPTGTLH